MLQTPTNTKLFENKPLVTIFLYKKNDPIDLTSHRPIILAIIIYKHFTSILQSLLANCGKTHQILDNSQQGFRAERCTTRQFQTLIYALEDALEEFTKIYTSST